MPLDPSISLQVRPMADPVESYGRALQLKALAGQQSLQAEQLAGVRDARQRQVKLRELLGGLPADVTDDQRIGALRGGGYFDEADKLDAGILNRRKTDADIGRVTAEAANKTFDTTKRRLDAAGSVVSSVLGRTQTPTHEDVYGAISQAAQLYGLSPEEQSTLVRSLPGNPAQLRPWLVQQGLQLMDAKQRFEAVNPRFDKVNSGKVTQFVDTNPVTNPGGPAPVRMTTTPGEDLSAATTRRGQNMTDARARETNATSREGARVQVINDPERGVLLVDKGTGLVRPGVGLNGQPVAGESAVKRQGSAARSLPLLDEADRLIGESTGSYLGAGIDLGAQVFGKATQGAQAAAQLKVLEGQLMMAQPRMEGPQSDRDVALYRQLAGQIGDPTVPAEMKRAALQTIRGLAEKYSGGAGRVAGPVAPAGGAGVPPDIAAILQKHGGR